MRGICDKQVLQNFYQFYQAVLLMLLIFIFWFLYHISISTCYELPETCFSSQFSIATISEFKTVNINKSFYRLILILLGDISLNPGPVCNQHPQNLKEGDIFKIKRLHLLHLNINSLLSKTDELRYIAKLSNVAVMGISESKLDNYILDSEIQIDNYQILCCDRNRTGGGVACCVRNNLSHNEKEFFLEERIINRPPNQSNSCKL